MRLEFNLELDQIKTPRFSVEAVEGIGKLFTLATLVLNVLETKDQVEVVFHGLHPEGPGCDLSRNQGIMATAMHCVNAIPAACRAQPGIQTYLDLPLVSGRAAAALAGPRSL